MDRDAIEDRKAPAGRRRRRAPIAALIFFLCLAAGALYTAPLWLPVGFSDDRQAVGMERALRRWRWSMGLPMPGQPELARLSARLSAQGLAEGAPIFVRIFKREFELELWMKRDGAFVHFATYPICVWSGRLGPKLREGDGQAPEGFYSVDAGALNPNSRYYRSFNVGYPNAFDRSRGRTGSLIMVHGSCASVGCFAMTDAQMTEIWQLVTAALRGGQKRFQVQIFPFRLSEARLAAYRDHAEHEFWRTLYAGQALFDATHLPPRVFACNGDYAFAPAGVYPDGDGGIENGCPAAAAASSSRPGDLSTAGPW